MGKSKKSKKVNQKNIQHEKSSFKLYAGAGILIVAIAVGIIALVMSQQDTGPEAIESQQVASADVHIKGNPDAPNQLTKYSDFGCVHCANQHVLLKEFFEEHGDNFSLQIMHFPINNNALSRMAIAAALSAGRQGQYWEMVDLIYANPTQWRSDPQSAFISFVDELGLDREQFVADMNDEDMAYKIVQDYFEFRDMGINATPTLFLNGERVPNPRTLDQLKSTIL